MKGGVLFDHLLMLIAESPLDTVRFKKGQKKFQNVPWGWGGGGGVTGLGIIREENMACHTIKTAVLIDAFLWTLQYDSRRI